MNRIDRVIETMFQILPKTDFVFVVICLSSLTICLFNLNIKPFGQTQRSVYIVMLN